MQGYAANRYKMLENKYPLLINLVVTKTTASIEGTFTLHGCTSSRTRPFIRKRFLFDFGRVANGNSSKIKQKLLRKKRTCFTLNVEDMFRSRVE